MKRVLLLTLLACSGCADFVCGEVWTSPDGAMSLARPEASGFVELPPGPILLVGWMTKDNSVMLGVTQ